MPSPAARRRAVSSNSSFDLLGNRGARPAETAQKIGTAKRKFRKLGEGLAD